MYLSYSRLASYIFCPYRYYLEYIEEIRPPFTASASFGASLHRTLEGFYALPLNRPLLHDLFSLYFRRWLRYGYRSRDEEARYFDEGMTILEEYYERNILEFRPALFVEKRFSVDLGGVEFAGVVDRVDKLDNDSYRVIDYKTAKRGETLESLQLPLYHLALERLFGYPPQDLLYYFLREQETMRCEMREDKQEEALAMILRVAEGVRRNRFPKNRGENCQACDFNRFCTLEESSRGLVPRQ